MYEFPVHRRNLFKWADGHQRGSEISLEFGECLVRLPRCIVVVYKLNLYTASS